MATVKYYAVKNGRNEGVYTSWNECKAQVDGYSDAIYKAFKTKEDAEYFLKSECCPISNNSNEIKPVQLNAKISGVKEIVVAYIDGSYSEESQKYSYGCVLITNKIIELSGIGDNQEAVGMRNVAGELLGAMCAIKWAVDNKFLKITIYHDYEGIAKWATGEWKAKRPSTKKYISFMKKYQQKIIIDFIKVLAHSGVEYNERADKLAKKALATNNQPYTPVEDAKNQKEIELLKKIMESKDRVKNKCLFKMLNYEITERKLHKFVKEIWKKDGNQENLIDSYMIDVDTENFIIQWEIKDKNGVFHNNSIKIY